MEKHLLAAQRFLEGLRQLPHFDTLCQRQYDQLLRAFSKNGAKGLSVDQAGSFLEKMDLTLWGQERAEGIRKVVAEQVEVHAESEQPRRSMQDFENCFLFLKAIHWQRLADEKVARSEIVEEIIDHVGLLGLRCPTEGTFATLVALVYGVFGTRHLNQEDKFKLLKQCKVITRISLGKVQK